MEVLDIDRQLAKLRGTQPGVRAADVWYEAYRRRVTNFDNWLGGKNHKPTFFGALWTFCWVRARRRHARAPHPRALEAAAEDRRTARARARCASTR